MTETTAIEPLRISFDVSCSVDHAFHTWTAKTSVWWPIEHTSPDRPGATVQIEPRIGGRVFERQTSGEETDWGLVTLWDPPRSLGYTWFIMTTIDRSTDIEIRFEPIEPRRTRVEIVHTGWERLGDFGLDWRNRNHEGWNAVVAPFIEACSLSG